MKIDVLGTKYTITTNADIEALGIDGICKEYSKIIEVRPKEIMLDDTVTDEEKEKRFKHVMRHELIHAFLCESGLDEFSSNERLVDWIAFQFPKLHKAFIQAGCEDN